MEHIFTKAIILNVIDYNDTQIIVNAYTSEMGRLTFITSRKKNKIKTKVILQPLYLVEIIFKYDNKKEIQRIDNLNIWNPYTDIPNNAGKTFTALFLSELLLKTLKEQVQNKELFDFCINSFHLFDITTSNWNSFHLNFMIHLTKYLGFYPTFGILSNEQILKINPSTVKLIEQLIKISMQNFTSIKHSRLERQEILAILIEYYQKHIPVGVLNSCEVLRQM